MDSVGFGIILPVLPDLLIQITGEDLASSARYGGWLMFVYAFMQFFFAPVLGNLSDAVGRRPVLLLSMIVLGINYLLMGLATSLWMLLAGRIISGLGASTMSTCNAYIADVIPKERRPQYFGMLGAAFGMGFIIGPVVGGFLGEYGPRIPFMATAALFFLNCLFGYLILPESLEKENQRPFNFRQANPFSTFRQLSEFRIVLGIMIVLFLYNLGHHVLPSVWSYYAIEKFSWSPKEIGYSLGFIGILMVFVQGYLIQVAIPRIGTRWSAIIGMSATVLAFGGYAFAGTTGMMYAAMIPGALGALAGPALNGIASGQVSAARQGELQGGLASVMSLTSIISPPVMTQTFGYFSEPGGPLYFPGAPFLLAAFLTLCSLGLFAFTTRTWQPPGSGK